MADCSELRIQEGFDARIAARRADAAFQQRLDSLIEREREVLDRLR